jgi:hypothetical protein
MLPVMDDYEVIFLAEFEDIFDTYSMLLENVVVHRTPIQYY